MNNILNYRQISNEQMNKVLLEKVPLEERLKSVYLPIIVMDCACYLAEDLLQVLRQIKLSTTKQTSRIIRNCIDSYRDDNRTVMKSKLYNDLESKTKDIFQQLSDDIFVCQVQYKHLLFKINTKYDSELCRMVALIYVIREISNYVRELDRFFTNRFSSYLGRGITYVTEDNVHCLNLIKALNNLLNIIGVDGNLKNDQTDLALKVFKNRINTIDIWTKKA